MPSVLILGSGGREHALSWRLSRSPSVQQVYIAPGNACDFLTAPTDPNNPQEIVKFCKNNHVDLVVVGPEAYLAAGIVDSLGRKVPVFGPGKDASQLEVFPLLGRETSPFRPPKYFQKNS